jgi:hypothetical protein
MSCSAAGDGALELAVKAAFLEKFPLFVTWPSDAFGSPTSPFKVCIIGRDPFGILIDRVLAGQTAGQHAIEPQRMGAADATQHCNIAYIDEPDPHEEARQVAALAGKPCLTVTSADADAGSIVNFVVVDGKVRFEIDADGMRASHLVISSKLLHLATTVKGTP